jgi:hypothetical protein
MDIQRGSVVFGGDTEIIGSIWGPGQGEALGVSLLVNKPQVYIIVSAVVYYLLLKTSSK